MDLGSGGEKAPLHPPNLVLLCHSKKPLAGGLGTWRVWAQASRACLPGSVPLLLSLLLPPLLGHVQLRLGKLSLYLSSSSSTISLMQPIPENTHLLSLSFFSPLLTLFCRPLLQEVLLGFAPALSTVPKMASLPVYWHPAFNAIIPRSVLHLCVSNMTQESQF